MSEQKGQNAEQKETSSKISKETPSETIMRIMEINSKISTQLDDELHMLAIVHAAYADNLSGVKSICGALTEQWRATLMKFAHLSEGTENMMYLLTQVRQETIISVAKEMCENKKQASFSQNLRLSEIVFPNGKTIAQIMNAAMLKAVTRESYRRFVSCCLISADMEVPIDLVSALYLSVVLGNDKEFTLHVVGILKGEKLLSVEVVKTALMIAEKFGHPEAVIFLSETANQEKMTEDVPPRFHMRKTARPWSPN